MTLRTSRKRSLRSLSDISKDMLPMNSVLEGGLASNLFVLVLRVLELGLAWWNWTTRLRPSKTCMSRLSRAACASETFLNSTYPKLRVVVDNPGALNIAKLGKDALQLLCSDFVVQVANV